MTISARLRTVHTALRFVLCLLVLTAFAAGFRLGSHEARVPLLVVLVAAAVVTAAMWWSERALAQLSARLAVGARADAYGAAREVLRQLSRTLPVEDVVPRLAETAGRTVGSPSAEVRVWLSDGAPLRRVWHSSNAEPAQPVTVDVAHSGASVGEIEVRVEDEDLPSFDRRLLDELAAPAGVALSTVRLTEELRRRRAELGELAAALSASRDRLLTAGRVTSEQLQKEVEDRVIRHIDQACAVLDQDLRAASTETGVALDALRTISRGIFPPRLMESGLDAALDGWMEQADRYADITIDDPAGALSSRAEIQACLYFCAVTALNAAPPGPVSMSIVAEDSTARMTISAGGEIEPQARMLVEDRITAFDGTVAGTPMTLTAFLPLRAVS